MLTSIELENYRGFKHYRMSSLRRVNLLVGKNNSGKTSILEAVQLLASGGDPRTLATIASQRGELVFAREARENYPPEAYTDVSHFFNSHDFSPGALFRIQADDGRGELVVRVVNLPEEQATLFDNGPVSRNSLGLAFEGVSAATFRNPVLIPVSDDGSISRDQLREVSRYKRTLRQERDEATPVEFITPYSLEPRSMGEMWDRVLLEARESEVIQAMRILEPRLNGIFFLSGERVMRYGNRAGIVASFEGQTRRFPLGSYGEGMRRLLELSLSLIRAKGGLLLIDEIDTGLHYSILGDMWHLVAKAAEQSNVQVFATTHSGDCVKGLAWLCENYPAIGNSATIQKIDPSLQEAVSLGPEEIKVAADQHIEVR